MHQPSRTLLVAVLALGLALAALPAAPAAEAQQCPPPGGLDPVWADPASPDLDFHVLGRGWGHGVGMSQHGAEGAGRQGCGVEQILTTYYPGTQISQRDDRSIRVGITFPGGARPDARVRVEVGDSAPWSFSGSGGDPPPQPGHEDDPSTDRRIRVDGSGHLVFERRVGQPWKEEWRAEHPGGHLSVPLGDGSRHVRLLDKGITYNRGTLRFHVAPQQDGGWRLVPVVQLSLEQYLYGLAEVPASWTDAALEAQAITGRSYAHRRSGDGHFDLLDSAADQVYNAMNKEREPQGGGRWVAAVDRTAGRVLTYGGAIAETFYSSAHGGQSERLGFSGFFDASAQRPYLQPVDDSRWEAAAPVTTAIRWSASYSRAHMTAAFSHLGVGTVLSIQTPAPRGAGHRIGVPGRTNADGQHYGGVVVAGSEDTARMSGLEFVNALQASEDRPRLDRRSELFRVVTGPQCRPSEDQSGNETVRRSSGPHRVATAAAVSGQHWEASADVVLATSITFPDALSAGVLAARLGAPILLTRFSELDPEAEAELRRLEPERVHLMGGTAALSPQVEAQVAALGFETRRVEGPSRFDTAAAAARTAGPSETGEVALANGNDWPDAVSAGALSGGPDRVPTLLSLRDEVPSVTLDALRALEAEKVLLIGGSAVLSGGVVQQLEGEGFEVERRSGPNRFATSVAVAEDAAGRADGDRPVVLATGADFPDALSAGGLVARIAGGLVLTTVCDLGSILDEAGEAITVEHLRAGPYDGGVIVGGTAAVSDLVREQATAAITGDG